MFFPFLDDMLLQNAREKGDVEKYVCVKLYHKKQRHASVGLGGLYTLHAGLICIFMNEGKFHFLQRVVKL